MSVNRNVTVPVTIEHLVVCADEVAMVVGSAGGTVGRWPRCRLARVATTA